MNKKEILKERQKAAEIAQNLFDVCKKYQNTWSEKTLNAKPTGYFIVFEVKDEGWWCEAKCISKHVVLSEASDVIRKGDWK